MNERDEADDSTFFRGMAYGQAIVHGKTFHVVDSPEIAFLRARVVELEAEEAALKADLTSYMDVANQYMRGEEAMERLLAQIISCLHRQNPKVQHNYWHVTKGRHIEFGKYVSEANDLLVKRRAHIEEGEG